MSDNGYVKIDLFHKLPTPYNDMLFKALHECEDVELLVHHLWKTRWNRPWTVTLATDYPNNYLETRLGIDWGLLKRALLERGSFFLVGDWGHLASIVVLLTRIIVKAPVSVWADTPQEQLHRPWLKRVLRQAFLSWLLPRLDFAFGTGQPGIEALMKMGVSEERVVNLPCFVDLDLPVSCLKKDSIHKQSQFFRKLVCSDGGIVFLMAGTCVHKKGQDIGIRAFAACSDILGTNIGMIIAGDGPERESLEKLAKTLGVADRVAFLGWLNPEEMQAAYAACDVVLHCARWDPFPLVILEGMSWSKVVIGSDVCGSVQDRIIHGVNGFVFQSENVNALVDIMKKLILEFEKTHIIGLEARRTSEEWPVERGVETIVQAAHLALSTRR